MLVLWAKIAQGFTLGGQLCICVARTFRKACPRPDFLGRVTCPKSNPKEFSVQDLGIAVPVPREAELSFPL